jgi:ribosomal protein S18 acetylase RimI-like enzyme
MGQLEAQYAEHKDFEDLLELAKEVEHLFGPMSNEESFQKALKETIDEKRGFCINSEKNLCGGIMISTKNNEIAWLVVSKQHKKKGIGKALMDKALKCLDKNKDIFVNTFDDTTKEGKVAQSFYKSFGFTVDSKGEPTPAGISTVHMKRKADNQ